MTIVARSGSFGVLVTDSTRKHKRRWCGTYPTVEEAREVERRESGRTRRRYTRSPTGPWTLAHKEDREKCRSCGAPATTLHHIVPRAVNGHEHGTVATNGMPLCRPCHVGWHARRIAIPRSRLTDEEIAFGIAAVGMDWLDANYPPVGELKALDVADDLRDEVLRLQNENERLHRKIDRVYDILGSRT